MPAAATELRDPEPADLQDLGQRTVHHVLDGGVHLGAGDLRILWFHVLANSLAPLIVRLTFVFATAILAEAVLSYIGVGPPPPAPSCSQ